ncbi:MAG TPA: type II secretion system protein [Candidatus Saccharimonadales bacterium]|nr:type II secretion system protein [Candidatus Saccharimonadales bacterium]
MRYTIAKLDSRGISLTETVFVLAIMGFIIILVFFVLPQAHTAHRDAQRKLYLEQVATNIEKYKENFPVSHNQYPPDSGTFNTNFAPPGGSYAVVKDDNDPLSHTLYNFTGVMFIPTSSQPAGITYELGHDCNNDPSSIGIYRIKIGLESGVIYCLDNH